MQPDKEGHFVNVWGTSQGKCGSLEGGRWARRGGARNSRGKRNERRSNLEPVTDADDFDAWRLRGDQGAGNRAERAGVGGGRRGGQVTAIVKLRRQKDGAEE